MTTSSVQNSAQQTENLLPRWDLTDFYASQNDPKIEEDLNEAEKMAKAFAATYKGKFAATNSWTGDTLYQGIVDYEKIDELLGKLISYGYLLFATNVNNPPVLQFFQMVQERSTIISSHLIFFSLELNQIEDDVLQKAYQNSSQLSHYKAWIEGIRLFRSHQLSADLEKLLHEKSVTGRSAWVRLFEETLAGIKFSLNGEDMALAEVLNRFGNKDAKVRHDAAQALSEGLTRHTSILTLVTNTLAKDKEIEDTWRLYPHPVASRNLSNQVEDEVVEALTTAVKESYGRLSHRYYFLKAKWLGLEKLEYWDRNAPLPDATDTLISWPEAQNIVLNAYNDFNPVLAKIGRRFFDQPWIDAPSQPGKESGAFSHPTVPSVHPYILLNYHGKLRDVMTLAHELGHGIHQVLAADQGLFLSGTPLTIAETASVFGEMLTFKALLAKTTTTAQRRSLLASKVDDMMNTVVRQIAFFEFERTLHTRRRSGELTAEDIADIWMKTQQEALGESVRIDPIVRPFWGYISHFIHAPFYVYAYAFGDCLVNSLYSVYESGHPNFTELYVDLLKAGGSKRYPELLKPFGLDAKNPLFWQQGLNVISGFIDELEKIS
ncbi:MAG: M3 family oligoendopeptidase [Alphaproteobacteria bacterium]|nr:M3 family oligoendopeptidase [Alphaproteobacteria bacterium]